MRGFTESLNVSVASGVLMYTLMNRLRASGISWRLPEEAQLELKIQWARKAIAWSETLIELFESGERL
jgi:tRNA (guanosine-2'-O-)-methyltransferase